MVFTCRNLDMQYAKKYKSTIDCLTKENTSLKRIG